MLGMQQCPGDHHEVTRTAPIARIAAAAIGVHVLAACALLPRETEPEAHAPASTSLAVPVPPVPATKPAAGVHPEFLVGADQHQILDILGEPERREERSPAIAWIYHNGPCRLDLLLYPDLETDRWIALAYQMRNEGGEPCPTDTTFAAGASGDG